MCGKYENEPRRIQILLDENDRHSERIKELERLLKAEKDETAKLRMLLSEYDLQYGVPEYEDRIQSLENFQKVSYKLYRKIEELGNVMLIFSAEKRDDVSISKKELSGLIKLKESAERELTRYLKLTSAGLAALLSFQAKDNKQFKERCDDDQ